MHYLMSLREDIRICIFNSVRVHFISSSWLGVVFTLAKS